MMTAASILNKNVYGLLNVAEKLDGERILYPKIVS